MKLAHIIVDWVLLRQTASFITNNRVIFNIKGNHYRIIIAIKYRHGIVYIRFVGTHAEYDKINAATI